MTIEALIFDVDGTLADTEEAHRQAFNEAFAELGLPWVWSREHYAELLKTTGGKERIAAHVNALDTLIVQRDALRARIPEIHARKTARYTRQVRSGSISLRPGVARLLHEARAIGVRLAIASTTSWESIDALLTTALAPDAPAWFDAIASGDDVARKKPASDIFDLVLSKMRLAARDCIAFEDSGRGVAAAKAAGLFTVVTPTSWTRDDNFTAADLVLPNLGDPDHPLEGDDAKRAGGPMLRLDELLHLHAIFDAADGRAPEHRGRSRRSKPPVDSSDPSADAEDNGFSSR